MAKKTVSAKDARSALLKDLQANSNKSALNNIYNKTSRSSKSLSTILDDDALLPNNYNQRKATELSNKNLTVQDCLAIISEPEIEEIVSKLTDELIIYNTDNNYFCEPSTKAINALDIPDADKEKLIKDIQDAFKHVYRLLRFSRYNIRQTKSVQTKMKKWLATGKMAYFIVYDDVNKPTTIVDIIEIDLQKYTLVKHEEYIKLSKNSNETKYVVYWSIHENGGTNANGMYSHSTNTVAFNYSILNIQYSKNIFVDNEIVYVDWSNIDDVSDKNISYVASLVRPFNILRTMERTKIIWAVMNSRYRTMFTVPVKGKGRVRGKQTITETRSEYKETIQFNEADGRITVNGSPDLPFNKEIWVGETASGKLSIDNLGSTNGPDFSDMSNIQPWNQRLQKASRLPMSRYEDNNSVYWDNNPMQISLEERRFGQFIDPIQQMFVETIRKPMYNQLLIKNPKYIGDENIIDAITITCNKYSQYQQMMELEILGKTFELISAARNGMTKFNKDGIEIPVLATDYLLEKYLPMTLSEQQRNEELLDAEIKATLKAKQNKAFDDANEFD